MKKVLWLTTRATIVSAWQRAMDRMKYMNKTAWTDMMKLIPRTWTMSAFMTNTQYNLQVNNICGIQQGNIGAQRQANNNIA